MRSKEEFLIFINSYELIDLPLAGGLTIKYILHEQNHSVSVIQVLRASFHAGSAVGTSKEDILSLFDHIRIHSYVWNKVRLEIERWEWVEEVKRVNCTQTKVQSFAPFFFYVLSCLFVPL